VSDALPLFEFVRDGARQLAIIVRGSSSREKYNFPTAPESTLQMGVTFYRQDDVVAPHAHHQRHAASRDCQEFLLVQEGALEVNIYREDGTLIASFELGPGDAVLFQDGGHGLRCLAPTRLLEVKQGPYVSPELDKYLIPATAGARADE
jgi:cupin fold WbuC family metalloprotein